MPLGEIVAEGFARIFVEIFFEGVAYFTGYIVLYPFTFGKVKSKFSDNVISLVGMAFWIVAISLFFLLPGEAGAEL